MRDITKITMYDTTRKASILEQLGKGEIIISCRKL
jgi:hypothetical protein